MSIFAVIDATGTLPAFYDDALHETIPEGAVPITEAAWTDFLLHQGSRKWNAATATFEPYVPPSPPVDAPLAVTRLQGRLALSRAGLLAKAEAAIAAAGGEIAIWYADAQTWRRDDPHIAQIAAALGLTSDQVDALFTAAAAI